VTTTSATLVLVLGLVAFGLVAVTVLLRMLRIQREEAGAAYREVGDYAVGKHGFVVSKEPSVPVEIVPAGHRHQWIEEEAFRFAQPWGPESWYGQFIHWQMCADCGSVREVTYTAIY